MAGPHFSHPNSRPPMHSTQLLTPPAATERVTDAAITAAIKMLLVNKKGLVAHQIAVQTRDGIVELSGITTNLMVLRVVQGVRGVEAAELMIRGGAFLHSDEEIVVQIQEQLDWDIRVNGALVVGGIHEQVVHLARWARPTTGCMPPPAHRCRLRSVPTVPPARPQCLRTDF